MKFFVGNFWSRVRRFIWKKIFVKGEFIGKIYRVFGVSL